MRLNRHITETEFWNELMDGIYGPRKGGARIIIDAENASTGVGKTGLAVAFARLLSRAFGYEMQEDDMTLSGAEYLRRWREHPGSEQPSVLILDELSGAGAGDARRAMSNQNVDLGRSWQLMRKKRIVTLTTLPHWSDADKKMRRFADYRLWCRSEKIGYFRPYRVGASFDKGGVETYSMDEKRDIRFPNLDAADDPFYKNVTDKKDQLLDAATTDADDLVAVADGGNQKQDPEDAKRDEKKRLAQRMRDDGMTCREVANIVDMSAGWVSDHTENPA